jgi:predicted permease
VLTVHAALGAGPWQVTLQVLGEAFFLAVGGGASGLLGGWCASRYIEVTLAGNWGYHWMRVGIDPAVILFTVGLVVIVTVVAGMAPAWRSRRLDLVGALKTRSVHEGPRAGWGSATLLGVQVAFSAASLVAAALMAIGLLRMGRAAGDIAGEEILIASVSLDASRYADPSQRADLRQRLHGALDRTGARAAALSTGIPGFRGEPVAVEIEGSEKRSEGDTELPLLSGVSAEFFEAFDLETLRGRRLTPRDGRLLDPVAVVSADFASRRLAGRDPIGVRLRLGGGGVPDRWVRVVGVVEGFGGKAAARGWIYVPIEQRDPTTFFLMLRARSGDAHRLVSDLRGAVHAVDPELALDASMLGTPAYTLEEVLDYVRRFYRTTGILALLGLYGILSLEVGQRIREMGIRMALGAEPGRVVSRILRRGLIRVLPGFLLGLILAWVGSPAFRLFLAGAEPRDARVFAFAAGLYLAGVLAAAGSPALRASRADPAEVLRDE